MTDYSNNIPEDREVDQGLPIDNEAQDQPANNNGSKDRQLSMVSRKYDIDGDGQLDEAELAMRTMDKSGRGHLTNEQVHSIMLNHMDTQRELFKVKKVVMGLLAFVVLLTLSNLGTSIAAAYLAKDTTTNDKDELVNSKTGEAVATQTTSDIFKVLHPNDVGGERRLECDGSKNAGYSCGVTSYLELDQTTAETIIGKCSKSSVKIERTFKSGNEKTTQICPGKNFDKSGKNAALTWAKLTYENGEVVTITQLAETGFFVIDGDRFTQNEGEECDVTGDCDSGLDCINDVCAASANAVTTTTGIDDGSASDGSACDGNDIVCKVGSSCFIATCLNPPCGTCVDSCEVDEDCTDSWSTVCYNDSILGTDKDGLSIKTCGTCDPADTNLPASGCDAAAPKCIQGFGRGQCGCNEDSDCATDATCTSLWCEPPIGDIVNSCLTDSYIISACDGLSATTTEAPRVL